MAFYDGPITPGPDQDQSDFVLFAEKQTRCSKNLPSILPYSPPTSTMENNYSSYETYFSTPVFSHPNGYGQPIWGAQLASQDLRYLQHSHNSSPAHSASHAFEYHPPTLSSSSVKSTTSSAVASPFLRSLNSNHPDAWTQLHQDSDFHPPILQNQYYSDEVLFTGDAEFDTTVAQDKVPNCIGMPASLLQPSSLHYSTCKRKQAFS